MTMSEITTGLPTTQNHSTRRAYTIVYKSFIFNALFPVSIFIHAELQCALLASDNRNLLVLLKIKNNHQQCPQTMTLEPRLADWAGSSDAVGCLAMVKAKVPGLLTCKINSDGGGAPQVHLLGDAASIRRGKMLLEIHFRHQSKISTFHDTRERKLQALEEQKNRYDSAPSAVLECFHDSGGIMVMS